MKDEEMQKNDGRAATESDLLLGKIEVEKEPNQDANNDDEEQENTLLETITENVEIMVENAQEVATEIQDAIVEEVQAVVEEVQEVKDNFMEELEKKDDGESLFMEMALTRNLSILPSDLLQAASAQQQQQHHQANLQDDSKPMLPVNSSNVPGEEQPIPFHAYATLALAVVALSSIGPSLDMQTGVEPTMKIFWRMIGTAMFLFPFALRSTLQSGLPHMAHTQWFTFGFASFCYAVMCVGFVIALEYTSVGNAVIFANSQAILLLLGKFFVGAPVLLLEGIGALIAFCGGVLCTVDASITTTAEVGEDEVSPIWSAWGDIVALMAGLGGVGYLITAKSVRAHFPNVYVFMFLNMVCAAAFTLTYMLISEQDVTFGRDIHNGLFGFLNGRYDRLPLELFMVVVCNMTGSLGYVRSMQYFETIIISVATLMEPVVASLLAFVMGVGVLPGQLGWLGNVLVVVGTFCVLAPSTKKS